MRYTIPSRQLRGVLSCTRHHHEKSRNKVSQRGLVNADGIHKQQLLPWRAAVAVDIMSGVLPLLFAIFFCFAITDTQP